MSAMRNTVTAKTVSHFKESASMGRINQIMTLTVYNYRLITELKRDHNKVPREHTKKNLT